MFRYILVGLLVFSLIASIAVGWAEASEAEARVLKYWKIIIAEACSEGYDGMYAVACVIRNRLDAGMHDGCVSKYRPDLDKFVEKQGVSVTLQANNICDRVFNRCGFDTTRGATHFENVKKYGMPNWARNMVVTTQIGNHTFFKGR